MRLGILSDTHDQLDRTRVAAQALLVEGAEMFVHCGDVTGPKIVSACGSRPCVFAFGNHDADNVPALIQAIREVGGTCLEWGGEVTLAGKRIAVAHGHMSRDVRPLLAERPDYLLSGHSHILADWREGATRRINPGALHEAAQYTVALLDLSTDDLRFLTVS